MLALREAWSDGDGPLPACTWARCAHARRRSALDVPARRVGRGPSEATFDPDRLGPLGIGAAHARSHGERHPPHLRLLRLPRALL